MIIDYDHSQNIHTVIGPEAAIRTMFSNHKPKSVLDVGCGIGTWLKAMIEFGVSEVIGIDAMEIPENLFLAPRACFHHQDLSSAWELGRKFDVALCLEVAEHLDEICAPNLVKSLVSHADLVFFSAACPDQMGQHHINCQWPAYWQEIFNRYGYQCSDEIRWRLWEDDRIEPWYRQNMFAAWPNLAKAGNEPRIRPVIHPDMIPYMLTTSYI